ncbi:MAG: hypothetical protein V1836_02140 [Candidatus Aenigmatarchaeota archaeon]
MIEIIAAAFATGILVKFVDDIHDKPMKRFKNVEMFFGFSYGLLLSYVALKSADVANLWIAVVLANFLAGKLDSPGHRIGAFSMFAILFILGFPMLQPALFLIFLAAAYADEFFSDLADAKKIKNKTIAKIILCRPFLEVAAFVAAAITATWIIFASIIAFDLGYVATKKLITA